MKEPEISIVIPVYNEEDNINLLYDKIKQVMGRIKKSYEVIFVDDGSTDNSFKVLERLHRQNKNVKIVKFRSNFGQTAALNVGFKYAKSPVIVTMDADMQNDPNDIPNLLSNLKEGFDVVSGWRYKRNDTVSKVFFSKLSNLLRGMVTKETIHDSGCSLKAYKKECFDDLELYGEMHRFIPTLLRWKGFKVGEVKVSHLPRKYGTSKYNYNRIFRGFVDLINAKLWMDYSTRPSYLFFKLGIFNILISILFFLYNIIRYGFDFNVGPVLLGSVLFFIIGVQFLSFGFLAEIQVKTYHKTYRSLEKSGSTYSIEKVLER